MNEYQTKVIANLPKEKRDFVEKQLAIYADASDFMKGSMFLPCDGRCYSCNKDVIGYEIENGNDGSKCVTGCHYCHRSFCD